MQQACVLHAFLQVSRSEVKDLGQMKAIKQLSDSGQLSSLNGFVPRVIVLLV